ncbi:Cytochrome oxidase subunit II copper A binding domain-containing protein [uncultured Gammaproteobacteria bacterium]
MTASLQTCSVQADEAGAGPVTRAEVLAVLVLAVVIAGLFVAMPVWRGGAGLSYASYTISPTEFEAKVAAMVARYRVGEDKGEPVVHPPPGDVYLVAERWRFRPQLELEAGQSYRLHISSPDILHGVVVAGAEALVVPGRAAVLPLTPAKAGQIAMQCSEYCGLSHSKMLAWLTVVDKPVQ